MAEASASAASSTGINAPGGSINKGNQLLWILAIGAVLVLAWLKWRKH